MTKRKNYMKMISVVLFITIIMNFLPIQSILATQQENATNNNTSSNSTKLTNNLELTTFIYDKNGSKMEELHGNENRVLIDYKDLPKHVVNAVISIEDERFFEHKGIDIKRTLGAIFTYITNKGKSDFGGSTITQQLVKNITQDKETSITRKIREWFRALKLEKAMSKEEIFAGYVNTIYMG